MYMHANTKVFIANMYVSISYKIAVHNGFWPTSGWPFVHACVLAPLSAVSIEGFRCSVIPGRLPPCLFGVAAMFFGVLYNY